MEKSFEKIYSAGEPEKEAEETVPAVEIPKKDWQTIEIIAKRVGGDFGMEIKLGKPGGGSFFNPEDGSITFDPLHIKEKPEEAKFVAGHEGSHRAITPGPREIGLSREQIQERYSQIGFGYLQNVIEDPAVNDWMRRCFPGLEPYTTNTYDERLKEENAVLSTPEVQKIAAQLGYWPKFSQYGSEVIRDWHQKRFSKKLDPAVEKALKRTIGLARESIGIIPESRDRKEIITKGQRRFENNTNYIWPEVKKLVEMDLHTEELRQMLNKPDFFDKLPKEAKAEIKKVGGVPYPEDKLSKETKKEIEKLFKKLPQEKQRELRDKAKKQLEDFEDALNKGLEGKLNKNKPENHKERRKKEETKRGAAEKSLKVREERERIEQELERIRREKMTPYEKARNEVSPLIDDFYYRLRQILRPEEYGSEELGWPSGKEPDIARAMQAERDISQREKMWIRETSSGKKDYRFWHLIDLSGSMRGTKIEETFKGFIVVGEGGDRLENLNSENSTFHQGISGFHSKIFPFKEMRERFDQNIEGRLSTMLERIKDSDASTNTYAGTEMTLNKMKEGLGESGNFLLTYSDGEPNDDIREKLKKLLKESKEERKKLKLKTGLIWLGEPFGKSDYENLSEEYQEDINKMDKEVLTDIRETADKNNYEKATLKLLIEVYGYDFGLAMPAVQPKAEEGKEKKNFAEALTNLLEDILKNPEKY